MGGKVPSVKSCCCFTLVFALFPIGFGAIYSTDYLYGLKTKDWQATDAIVLSSTLQSTLSSTSRSKYLYRAEIIYEYVVNNHTYTSDLYYYTSGDAYTNDRMKWSDIVSEYSVGMNITVYFNPEDPSEAVIMQGPSPDNVIALIIIIFLEIAICIGAFFGIRKVKQYE
ncbi:DUF3592 domain-containing protein [Candidatus Lokiarchaeum ossiferum]|uniref:DUF3592 domain-containing protein n=1 Tax=Candidatus Lokiarchaeum ossiferum TaxID=2951803 RepID=UPI00352D987D